VPHRLPLVLSINAGYVDCAGFLALQGLFSSHVTGNFVTLGAALTPLFAAQLALLLLAAVLAIHLGPFTNGDSGVALLTGMVLVVAMGIQNAVQRIHLTHTPPTTIMTSNTTQAVIDIVDVLRGGSDLAPVRARLASISLNIVAFAVGCAAAALLYSALHMWCFALPLALR
jgi:uncharacterized membrane protein YoaK (UPF0700 family)